MISQADLDKQLKQQKIKLGKWGRAEIAELANILTPNEKVSQVVNGYYENGFALLVSTDHRMLLIDKKPFNFLNVEDFRFDMINQLDYNHRLFNSGINVSAGPKNLTFKSTNQTSLRKLIDSVQCRMIEIKEEKKDVAERQHSKLDQLDHTLKAYIQAQLSQSDPEKRVNYLPGEQAAPASFNASVPDPGELSSQSALDDYLKQAAQSDTNERYIKTGNLLPRPKVDRFAAKVVFAKLPGLISARRRQLSGR